MEKKIRWGILGPGAIAHKFVQGLLLLKDAEIAAVGSRSLDKAVEFAGKYGVKKAFGSYEELVEYDNVDIIYIATPHPFHREHALMCIRSGKAVLCEKPFAINAGELQEIMDEARRYGVFLMEAMWTRYLPVIVQVRDWLDKGIIGDVRMVKADFGFSGDWNPEGRLLNLELGGGALLDVGVYCLSLASMVLGVKPVNISSTVHIGQTGVDEQFSVLLGYEDGRIANLSSAIRANLPNDAWIIGSKGRIHIPSFWTAKSARLIIDGQEEKEFTGDFESCGYQYEAQEAMSCMREGKRESSIMPIDESLEIMKIMDSIRRLWGLKYPFE